MTRRSVRTNQRARQGIQRTSSHSASTAAVPSMKAARPGWVWETAAPAATRTTRISTSGSHRKSGRDAMSTRSFGSRMMSPGMRSGVGTAPSLVALAEGRALRRGRRRDAGRRLHELLEEPERLAGSGDLADPAENVQRAAPVRRDLALDELADAEVVEDRADPLDALCRERRRRLVHGSQLAPRLRRRALEREHDRQRLLALRE